MPILENTMKFVLFGFPAAVALIVALGFLRGRINTIGLVSDENGSSSPARWQLLFISIAAAVSYLTKVAADTTGTALPPLPGWFTSAVLASNAVYLAGKGAGSGVFDTILSNITSLLRRG